MVLRITLTFEEPERYEWPIRWTAEHAVRAHLNRADIETVPTRRQGDGPLPVPVEPRRRRR